MRAAACRSVLGLATLAIAVGVFTFAPITVTVASSEFDGSWQSDVPRGGNGPVAQVVGGNATTNSKFPWQAQLWIETPDGTFICGGSLIHPLVVITAAHCVADESGELEQNLHVEVWLGRTELESGGEHHEGAGVLVHNGFDPETAVNDVALIALDSPSALARILIAGPDERALWTPSRDAYVTGWGATSETGELSSILMEALVLIVDDETCGQLHGTDFVSSVMLCAGLVGQHDTCSGDSGGPLQVPMDGGGFRLVGITSWGEGCGQLYSPGVYTRIADDPLRGFAREAVAMLGKAEGWPSLYTGVSVIGSGARPFGCGAAEGAVGEATASVDATQAAIAQSRKAAQSARARMRKAAKKKRAARRAERKAAQAVNKGYSRIVRFRHARARFGKATNRLITTQRHLGQTRRQLRETQSELRVANDALQAAIVRRDAVCGL